MKLDIALSASQRVSDYLERYVNDGSPSGFTLHDQMSSKTNPLGLEPFFHPLSVTTTDCRLETHSSSLFTCPQELLAPIAHPDAVSELSLKGVKSERMRGIRLVPTSSGRTCRLLDDKRGFFVKLHYPDLLGRINRAMPRHKLLAGVEVSDEIAVAISDGKLPSSIAIMPEVACVVLQSQACPDYTFGHVVRRSAGYPDAPDSARIPLFALWSFDRLAPLDAPLLAQILDRDPDAAVQLVLNVLVTLVDLFFTLWESTGLLYEVNAQNILVELDGALGLKRVVVRDFNSTEKDAAQRSRLGRTSNFVSGNYKVIPAEEHDLAQRRRSFAFDFKLCQYAIDPLLKALLLSGSEASEEILSRLRDHVSRKVDELPGDFFPSDGSWWSHPDVDLSGERPYLKNHDPMLRKVRR